MKRRPDCGYSYSVRPHYMRILCELVSKRIGAGSVRKAPPGAGGSAMAFEMNAPGNKIIQIIQTAWQHPFNQFSDIGYFALLVMDANDRQNDPLYYYISLVQPDTVKPVWLDVQAVIDTLVEFVEDSRKPVDERQFKPENNAGMNYGAWRGGLETLPASWSTEDRFIKRVAS